MGENKTSGISSVMLTILLILINIAIILFAYLFIFLNENIDYSKIIDNISNVIFIGVIFISISITLVLFLFFVSRKKTEEIAGKITEDLLNSRELFLQLFDNGPIPYLLISKEGKIQLQNKAALRLFGYELDDLEDKYFFDLHPEEDKRKSKQLFEFFKGGVPVKDREIQIVKNDNTRRWVILSIFPLKDRKMRVNSGLITLVDITERKKIDKAKTEFVSLASHQLRTPLAAVKWNMEMLLSGYVDTLSDKLRERIQKIYDGNERMIEIVDMLLKISRLELGTLSVKIEDVSVSDIADSVLEDLTLLIQTKKLILNKNFSSNLPAMKTDKGLIRMILQNLLSNAVKYTPDNGKVGIDISKNNEYTKIEVTDTGYGIPKDQQEKIFTKLFRADNVRLHVSDGTGLGLYLVKAITNLLGGEISFVSEENKGTKFTVILPTDQSNLGIDKKHLL